MKLLPFIKVGATPEQFGIKDNKDCAVRALANVSAFSYPEAHKLMADAGRKRNKGTPWNSLHSVYMATGAKEVTYYGRNTAIMACRFNAKHYNKSFTLKTFVDLYTSGKYIVIVRGHALAVCDGAVIDTFASRAGKRLMCVYKFD
jgi:hypothetical protein